MEQYRIGNNAVGGEVHNKISDETPLVDIKQNLDEISQIIVETVPVESIYLFGS